MEQQDSLGFKLTSRFLPSMLFAIFLPLSPLGLELLFTGKIDENNWSITAAVLAGSLMATSRNVAVFLGYGALAASVLLVYASRMSGGHPPPLLDHPGIVTFAVALIHSLERLNRHVVKGEPFFEFRV